MFFDDELEPVQHGPILGLCGDDPRPTWERQLAGLPAPCYRCLAYTGTSCALISPTPSGTLSVDRLDGDEGGSR